LIEDLAVCYLDDILRYSTNKKGHKEQVRKVLNRVREFGLSAKAEKWHFRFAEVGLLGFIIHPDGFGIQ
jgi:hypothetical protein